MDAQANKAAHRAKTASVRLTLAGWCVLGIATMVGLTAAKTQAPLMFPIFGGAIGALMVSVSIARRMLAPIEIERDVPTRLWQNQMVHVGYLLKNSAKKNDCVSVSVAEAAAEGFQIAPGFCASIQAGTTFRVGGRLIAGKRGQFNLPGVKLTTTFPFGILVASRIVMHEGNVTVWPARGKLKSELLMFGAVEISTTSPSVVSGGEDEFFGLREYRTGDNPRWIHWRRSANRHSPVVREMARPVPDTLWLIIDVYMPDDGRINQLRLEKMLRFASTLIDHAAVRGYQLALAMELPDGPAVYKPAAGKGQRCRILDALASTKIIANKQTMPPLTPSMLRRAQAILLTGNASLLPAGEIAPLARACRKLTLIEHDRLDEIFEDDNACLIVPQKKKKTRA